MFSMPPATCASACPSSIEAAAMLTAFSPDAHTLLIVVASMLVGRPAKMAACLAGACPTPAESTLPMYTASIEDTGTFDFSSADLIAVAPSCVAETVVKLPLNCVTVSRQFNSSVYNSYHCSRCATGTYDVCIPNLLLLLRGGAKLRLSHGGDFPQFYAEHRKLVATERGEALPRFERSPQA